MKRVGTGLLRSAGIIGLLAIAVPVTSGAGHAVAAPKGTPQTKQNLTKRGTTNLKQIGPGNSSTLGSETAVGPEADEEIPRSGLGGNTRLPANHVPTPAANAITSSNTGFSGFAGLTHFDQRTSGTGIYANTNYSLEPPDQGLCVGGGYVVEAINTAVRVFSTTGSPLTNTVSLNQFFQVSPAIIRNTPPTPNVRGDFTSDPKCYYDAATQRWFLTMLDTAQRQSDGASLAPTEQLIAVSQTSDPTGNWTTFSFYTTDDGTNNTPTHANCPCLGDQPLIGADQNGFYISTNEYQLPVLGGRFNGAQIYAISKSALEAAAAAAGTPSSGQTTGGALPTVTHIDLSSVATPDAGGIWYSLQPATVPEGGSFATGNNGTEYFLSALQFSGTLDNRIAVWALTNTASLNTTSALNLTDQVINSEVYGQPGDAQQKPGVTPLGAILTQSTLPENNLAGNDDRMNQVVYAAGKLWSGVNTLIQPPNGPTRVGIAYFIVTPSVDNTGQVSGTMANQGYVSANQENVMYPSIGVNTSGKGVIGFTLVGPDYYPSAGYALVDATNGAGAIHIAAAGVGPADGFTGYAPEGGTGRSERWGDYSAAVADASGKIWVANEYIGQACSVAEFVADNTFTCGGTRTQLANWGTFISQVTP